MNPQKPLVDYTDSELREGYRNCVEHVQYSANNYREEIMRRSQSRWTTIIAVATVVNVLVALTQLIRGIWH
jgi:hypothetical protein